MSARNFKLDTTKKQGVIKVIDLEGGKKAVDYRGTLIVTEIEYNTLQLDSAGWYSATTKKAMNRYFDLRNLPIRVSQENFTWYVYINGQKLQYNDRMIITL